MRYKRLPKNHVPVDKSVLTFGIAKPEPDPIHLVWIRTLPCCVTGRKDKVEAAHIRHQTDGGASSKPSDKWTVPLSHAQHRKQHGINSSEISFWNEHGGIKAAKELALNLHAVSGNTPKALQLLKDFRQWRTKYAAC